MDLFPTFARIANGKVPGDRMIDGVDQLGFLMGKKKKSNREAVVVYVGQEIFGIKWRNWKMMTKQVSKGFGEPIKRFGVPLLYYLHTDPATPLRSTLDRDRLDTLASGSGSCRSYQVTEKGTSDSTRYAGSV